MAGDDSERGRPASFDPKSGEVHGSGSGAGGGNPAEDYDQDPMAGAGAPATGGKGHPLPGSDEARHNEIPEDVAGGKGRGDDSRPVVQPGRDAANPDGERYRYDDNGRAEKI